MPGRLLKALVRVPLQRVIASAAMSTRTTHEQRTAAEHREAGIHAVTLAKVERINQRVRLLCLRPHRQKGREDLQASDLFA